MSAQWVGSRNEQVWYSLIADVEVYEESLGPFPGWRAVPRKADGERLGASYHASRRAALTAKRKYLRLAESARKKLACNG